jgi:hypothetical protein
MQNSAVVALAPLFEIYFSGLSGIYGQASANRFSLIILFIVLAFVLQCLVAIFITFHDAKAFRGGYPNVKNRNKNELIFAHALLIAAVYFVFYKLGRGTLLYNNPMAELVLATDLKFFLIGGLLSALSVTVYEISYIIFCRFRTA